MRRQQGWDVEGGEYGETIPQSEECVTRQRNRSGNGAWGTKHADKGLVFVNAKTNICSGRGRKLDGPSGDGRGGPA